MRSFPLLRFLSAALALGFVLVTSPRTGVSGPFEDGAAAHAIGNYRHAVELWLPLAEAGDPRAQFSLGIAHQRGEGLPQDLEKALDWYRKAADKGYARAQYNLAVMYHRGQGVPQNHEQAAKWYREAAERGEANAQFNLATMYTNGRGVPKDLVQAAKWYDLASARYLPSEKANKQKAIKLRNETVAKMTPEQIEEAKKQALAWKPK